MQIFKHRSKYLITILFIFQYITLQAQIIGSMPLIDIESRTEASIRLKINENFDITNKTQIRFNRSSEYFDQYNYDVIIGYKFFNSFKINVGGKFMGINTNNSGKKYIEEHFRTDYYLLHFFKVGRFTIKNRIRYHDYYNLSHRPKGNKKIQTSIRLKPEIKYNIRNWKLDPLLFGEFFYRTTSESRKPHNKYRMGIGTNYKIKHLGTIFVKYIFEYEIKSWNPKLTNIIDISYRYTIKRSPNE